jgi:hypothetical protein
MLRNTPIDPVADERTLVSNCNSLTTRDKVGGLTRRLLSSSICLSILLSACEKCRDDGKSTIQTCAQSSTLSVDVAPGFAITCAPLVIWHGGTGRCNDELCPSELDIFNGCEKDSEVGLFLWIPRVNETTYALPSSLVAMGAYFGPSTLKRSEPNPGPAYDTSDGSLEVVSGALSVHSSTNYGAGANDEDYGVDADIAIYFQTNTGAEFSITEHVVESACTLQYESYCSFD